MTLSGEQRRFVRERAGNCCEYCRVGEEDRFSFFQIDHIISVKHGGMDEMENLCLACYKCNGYKGSNVAAIDPETGQATRLYHPRQQKWEAQFRWSYRGSYPRGTLDYHGTVDE